MQELIEKYFMYYAIGAMAIFFIFWKIIPSLRKVKKITKILSGKIHFNKNSDISKEQYKKLAIGAIYSQQQTAYINSLTTGLGKSNIRELLSKWWGINNTNEAWEKLDYLAEKGFRYYFKTVLKAYQATGKEEQEKIILNGFDENNEKYEEDIQKAYQQLVYLQETWKELTENNIVLTEEELIKYNNIGWDCGRLVFLSRLCFDAGYISENEVWIYIDQAYELAANNFENWTAFSKSYIIGRGMWGGTSSGNEGIISIAEKLLNEEKSPWVQLNLAIFYNTT
ncbi:DUF1266 domain-containing protein [Aquimarina sp. I32.4]|uniref:DUF1266 domain-containing protein n=1 Tax=Aquimarina sp. I32.4 TaxID=2053903 RepID=UPI000CDF1074|nr:DUF1266 domain-containing protein [Aquimarina sp. I32.4]